MKAVMINNNGFMKYIDVQAKVPLLSTLGLSHIRVNFRPLSEEMLEDMQVPITTYEFVREYKNEFDDTILIYREMP